MIIHPMPLSEEAFAPYGQVVMKAQGGVERRPWSANVTNLRAQAKANITYMSLAAANYPVKVEVLERHPFSHQMFVPLEGTHHLLLVCPSLPDGTPDVAKIVAFEATGAQSVNYDANIWHAPRTVLFRPGAFVMLRWDTGAEADTEIHHLDTPIIVAQEKA